MDSTEKLLVRFKRYRFLIIITTLILLILVVVCVFVMCGGLDKVRERNESSGEKVSPVELAEEAVENGEGVLRAVIGTEASVEVESTSSIEDIIEISEIQTLSYQYNAIYRVNDSDGSPKYYVAYEGNVTLGVNLDDLVITYGDADNHVITVVIPEVSVLNCTVNAGTLDYIFVDQAYDNEQVPIEAHALCEQDLISRVNSDEAMLEIARENTEDSIRALTAPLVEQLYPDYELAIVWEDN